MGQAGTPGEGPFLSMYLTVACGSFVCGWAEGKGVEQAGVLDAETLQKALGGLPLGKEHAAHLPINALRKALEKMATAETS